VAWNGEYRERYHELLLDNINNLKREKPYSKSVTIIQSSGTGKSRMVREQSDLVFTLPFNLRPHHESKGQSLTLYIGGEFLLQRNKTSHILLQILK
jgi:hypothetical protein